MRFLSSVALCAACVCLPVRLESNKSAVAHAEPKVKRNSGKAKSVRRCIKFRQTLGADEESVDLQLTSKCKIEVVCSLEWEVVCSSHESDSVSTSEGSRSTTLDFLEEWQVNASAGSCESDWEIDKVRWHCLPAEA